MAVAGSGARRRVAGFCAAVIGVLSVLSAVGTSAVEPDTSIVVNARVNAASQGVFTVVEPSAVLAVPTVSELSLGGAEGDAASTVTRETITFDPPVARLQPNLPQTFRLSIGPIAKAGTYSGTVTLSFAPDPEAVTGQPTTAPLEATLGLTVNVAAAPATSPSPTPAPEIAVSTGSITARKVNCDNRVDCAMADFLLPLSERQPSLILGITNTGTTDVQAGRANLVVTGSSASTTISTTDTITGLAAGKTTTLTFALGAEMPDPDKYTGSVLVQASPTADPVTATVDLTVRSGPLMPAILILVGLAIGAATRFMRSKGNAIAALVDRFVLIDAAVRSLPAGDPDDRQAKAKLTVGFASLRALIDHQKTADAELVADSLDDALFLIRELTDLRERVKDVAGNSVVLTAVTEGLAAIPTLGGGTPKFDEVWVKLGDALEAAAAIGVSAPPSLNRGMNRDALAPHVSFRLVAPGAFDRAEVQVIELARPPLLQRIVARFASVGVGGFRKWFVWLVRVPLAILVWVVVFLAGLNILYVLPTADYVSGLFPQALALVVWGFGSTFVADFLKS